MAANQKLLATFASVKVAGLRLGSEAEKGIRFKAGAVPATVRFTSWVRLSCHCLPENLPDWLLQQPRVSANGKAAYRKQARRPAFAFPGSALSEEKRRMTAVAAFGRLDFLFSASALAWCFSQKEAAAGVLN